MAVSTASVTLPIRGRRDACLSSGCISVNSLHLPGRRRFASAIGTASKRATLIELADTILKREMTKKGGRNVI